MLKLPPHILPHADQAKARSDDMTGKMIDDIRRNLEAGVDPTAEWWSLANSIVCCAEPEVAASLASSLLRLATADEPVKPAPEKPAGVVQWAVVWTAKGSPELRENYVDTYADALWFVDQAGPVMTDHAIMQRTVTDWVEHTA
jgi:hypothetical protein